MYLDFPEFMHLCQNRHVITWSSGQTYLELGPHKRGMGFCLKCAVSTSFS